MAYTENEIYYPYDYDASADVPEDMKTMAESIDEVIGEIKGTQTSQGTRLSTLETDNTINKTNITNLQNTQSIQSTSIQSLQAENTKLKKNQIYGTATGSEVEITDSAEMGASIGVSGESTQDEEPSPSNPSEIKNLTGNTVCKARKKNMAYTGWAEDFVSRINNTSYAKLETKDNRNCLYYMGRAGYEDYDNQYMFKTKWKENTQYTIVCYLYSDGTSGNIGFKYTDGTSSYIENLPTNTWTRLILTSSSNKTLKYIRPVWQTEYTYIDLDTFMVLEGAYTADTLPDYVPYQETSVTFPFLEGQALRQDGYLADDGIHNVRKKIVFDGTENWQNYTDLGSTVRAFYTYTGVKKGGNCLCNILPQATNFELDEEGIGVTPYTSSLFYIKINKSRLSSENLQGFKTFLSECEPVIEYESETEEIETCTTAQQTAYNNLQNLILFEGYNHIEMTSPNGVKANLTVDYTKNTGIVIQNLDERIQALENAILEV